MFPLLAEGEDHTISCSYLSVRTHFSDPLSTASFVPPLPTPTQNKFLLSLLLGSLLMMAYFIATYWITTATIKQMNSLTDEINSTSIAEPFYVFTDNAQRQMIFNNSYLILNNDPEVLTDSNIASLFALDGSIHQQHSQNIAILGSYYDQAFNNIQMLDPCPILFNLKVSLNRKQPGERRKRGNLDGKGGG